MIKLKPGVPAMLVQLLVVLLLQALCFWFGCSKAHAQELRTPTVVFLSAATADWVSTYQCNKRGCYELNPTISWAEERPALMVATGAAMDVVGVYAWNRYVGRKHPKVARAGLYVATAFRIYLAVHNSTLNKGGNPSWRRK